jgi:hypothetical protein
VKYVPRTLSAIYATQNACAKTVPATKPQKFAVSTAIAGLAGGKKPVVASANNAIPTFLSFKTLADTSAA